MTFGQTSGPSASNQQLAELVELLRQAGYDGFREARHPFGLSQRQSNGKFTRDEAAALIDRLANGEALPQTSQSPPRPAGPPYASPGSRSPGVPPRRGHPTCFPPTPWPWPSPTNCWPRSSPAEA